MTNLNLKDITAGLIQQVDDLNLKNEVADVGKIIYAGDGIIKVTGLSKVKYFEVLSVENGSTAFALNLEENEVGAVVLDDDGNISQGMTVKTTGRLMSVPVGKNLLGRIVNPLGQPLDGKEQSKPTTGVKSKFRPLPSWTENPFANLCRQVCSVLTA